MAIINTNTQKRKAKTKITRCYQQMHDVETLSGVQLVTVVNVWMNDKF